MMTPRNRGPRARRPPKPSGVPDVDALSANEAPVLADYLRAVSAYIRQSPRMADGPKKSAQIILSSALGRCLKKELEEQVPGLNAYAGELDVAGALRTARADVSESHQLDGLRLAVEIKPVNLAVGRAIWNRFGDIRAFAVNIHLKFPFAVVGGVLTVPTWEWPRTPRTRPLVPADGDDLSGEDGTDETGPDGMPDETGRILTTPIIQRLVHRLQRTRLRDTEADAPHLLEAVTVVVYDPDTAELDPDLPLPGSGLRWDEFVKTLAETYELRFE